MMKMIKVTFLSTAHSCFDDRIFYKEALSLKKAGYIVSIITSCGNFNGVVNGIRIIGFKGGIPFFKLIKLFFIALKENSSIYSAHSFDALIIACLVKLFRPKVRTVHVVREFYLEEALVDQKVNFLKRIVLLISKAIDKKLNQVADFIIGVEEPKIAKYVNYGIPFQKISVIENYVRLDLFHFKSKTFDPNNFILGYVGGLSYNRGIKDLAVAAFQFAKRYKIKPKLLLIGRFLSPKEEKDFLTYCKEIKDTVEVKIKGWLSHDKVPEEIGKMDVCFILFSNSKRYEKVLSGKAGPIKLYEYMASGKPVIATDFKALKYIIEKERCGLIVDRKSGINGIVKAIEFYFKTPENIYIHGKNGRLAVEREYNWSVSERKLLRIYRSLA
jgi:glycosyltransferase involved in cell wall biosynthesis